MRWTSALVLVGTALLSTAAHAEDERVLPAALEGDPELVARVADELARRGVSIGAGDEVVMASLAQEGDGIRVALRDPQGRTTERLVSSVDTAAALVESWARRDIADPLLEPRAPPPPPPPAPLPPPPAPSVAVPVSIPPPPSQWIPVLQLSGESRDGSVWVAGSVGACIHVGILCLGGTARLARQLETREQQIADRYWVASKQTDLEALAVAELPISLGRPVLVLGVGAGLGWRLDGYGVLGGVRGEARVGLVLPLWSKLALEAGLAAALAPADDHFDPMFAEPRPTERQLRMGFGLRWGLP
jgi:hypothetical protein